MEFICKHCEKLTMGIPYRVTSEEAGVTLLNMIVCHSCYQAAKNLGLNAEEIGAENQVAPIFKPMFENNPSKPVLH